MFVDSAAHRIGDCCCCEPASRTNVKPFCCAYLVITAATFCATAPSFSFISLPKSLRASSTLRCRDFSFSSMLRRRVARSASLSLSPEVCRSFFSVSTSSLDALICCCFGWNLVFSSANTRWPSLVWPTTASNWMTAILVGPAGAVATGAPGAEGGSAAVCAGAEAWASALAPNVDASMQTSDKERFIWLRNSLTVLVGCPDCVFKGTCGALPCALPLRNSLRPRGAPKGAVCAQETRTEDISGTCDDYRAGFRCKVLHTAWTDPVANS